ncbi:Ulp1-like peptidase [Cucumis melo var. makuwa]|uniref:Ulp1-like peptidase n=1 Tax=Cucumis melo var. makuwa TaxID=1194695 RepID=A0A5D3CHD1_CUCMM|nr:Ulp1-like peptidase [Cucumis melo var. makuwa]
MLQKNIFDNKNTIVQAKLKLSTQEKAFMESQIQRDDNMKMEDGESMPDINNSDNTTPNDTTNNQSLDNNNLQSTSSPQLSPRRKKRQTVADESEMHPMTKKKSRRSNYKEQQSHSKSYTRLKKDVKEVHKDVSVLTSIVCRMDDTIRKQSLELSEMKQMLERLLQAMMILITSKMIFMMDLIKDNMDKDDNHQNREDMMSNDQPYVEEQHTQDRNMETQRKHQKESGGDISIDGRDANLLLTIRDISDNLNAQSQKEKDLPEMIITLPLVSQPLPLCEILPSSSNTLNQPAVAQLDQTVQIHEVSPSISNVNEESQLQSTSTEKNRISIDHGFAIIPLPEKMSYIRKLCKVGDVNYVIGCINIKEHWLATAADMKKCKIYVFDSMPNYVEKKLVDQALEMSTRYITSLAIAIGVDLHSKRFKYGPWPVIRSTITL